MSCQTDPRPNPEEYAAIVMELKNWILNDQTRRDHFNQAIESAQSHGIHNMQPMTTLEDLFCFINSNLFWVPSADFQPKEILFRLCTIYFLLDQPTVHVYQSSITPWTEGVTHDQPLSWLSAWMVRYSNALCEFMDSPASAAATETFRLNPSYRMNEYMEPRGGWRTFNEFFGRRHKPGYRPITGIGHSTIVTSPADFRFKEACRVSSDSTITAKGVTWPLEQMLAGSPYKDRFANGLWLHGFLNVDDYHRLHAPVAGTVLEARVIAGQNRMQVRASRDIMGVKGGSDGAARSTFDIVAQTGFQFCQTRGLMVLDTGKGLLAVLPIGMTTVSSVNFTAEVGVNLHKGEELGYFQFGGSDAVLIFDGSLNVVLSMKEEQHYKMGMEIATVGQWS